MAPHPSASHRVQPVQDVLRWFDGSHLSDDLQVISRPIAGLVTHLLSELPDSPELTNGLRRLLEAKDSFIRCAVAARPNPEEN